MSTRPTSEFNPHPPAPHDPRPAGLRLRVPGGARFLLTRDLDPRRETLRTAIAFIALAAVSAVLLNIGIFQGEKQRELRERWVALEDNVNEKVLEVRAVTNEFAQQVELVAMYTPASSLGSGVADLRPTLLRSANALHLHELTLLDPAGAPRVRARIEQPIPPIPIEIVQRLQRSQRTTLGIVPGDADRPSLVIALVPLRQGPALKGILAAYRHVDELLRPQLANGSGFGAGAGSYLVGREDRAVVVLSAPPDASGLTSGARTISGSGAFRAAAIAASGAESRVETVANDGDRSWAVTRWISDLDCGLVAQARFAELSAGTGDVLAGLIALDFAMVLLVTAAVVFWRRQYETGLAQREIDVTRRHANQIQAVFDNAFDAIVTFDDHGVIRTANPAAERLFRRAYAELHGMPLAQIVRGDCAAGHFTVPPLDRVVRTTAVRPDGTEVAIELSTSVAGDAADMVYTVIARDIDEQVAAENQIRSFANGLESSNRRLAELNAQLEEGSRLKSEFLANTSHELRTPLNGMIGFLQLVLDGMCSSRDEEREFLGQALGCSRHLLGLINDVLDIAKIEAGKLTLEIAAVDVRSVFDEVYTVTHVQAAQKGITLQFEPPPAGAQPARGDFLKVKQILINLVGNALKFTPSGSVTVRARPHSDLGHYRFEVVDTGIGIPADRQDQIFEKFIQADGSTTRKYGGTGLGLAISRSLVELMGGIIGVHSRGEGHGTTMHFSLPIWQEEADDTAPDRAPERIEGAAGPLVLIVEDDPASRRYLATLLQKSGYRTAEARHAEGGWLLAHRLKPALVVLDHALSCPDGAAMRSGWDLAERMATDDGTRHIPLVFVTGFEDAVRYRVRGSGLAHRAAVLVKPVVPDVLLDRVELLLGARYDRVVRILMADDDASVSAFVRKVLPESRYHIEIVNDGEECLHALQDQPRGFDLLLLDLAMPGVSGYDVLRALLRDGRAPEPPVIVLTHAAEPRNEEERSLLQRGVLDVLAKLTVRENPMLLAHIIDWHMQVHDEMAARTEPRANGEAAREEAA